MSVGSEHPAKELHLQVQLTPNTVTPTEPLRAGSLCPKCGEGKLDYNGLLELECPRCGYVASGGGACT